MEAQMEIRVDVLTDKGDGLKPHDTFTNDDGPLVHQMVDAWLDLIQNGIDGGEFVSGQITITI